VLIEIHSLKKKKKHATNTNGGLVSKKHSHEKHEAYGDVKQPTLNMFKETENSCPPTFENLQ